MRGLQGNTSMRHDMPLSEKKRMAEKKAICHLQTAYYQNMNLNLILPLIVILKTVHL